MTLQDTPYLYVRKNNRIYKSDDLRHLSTPKETASWQPVPHHLLVTHVKTSMNSLGISIIDEQHGVSNNEDRYFGLFAVKLNSADSPNLDYHTMVGLRNCHDKRFSVGLAWGARVMVCSNLSFTGEVVIRRKHTSGILKDLPFLVHSAMEGISAMEDVQQARFNMYKRKELFVNQTDVNNLVIAAMDKKVISSSHIGMILKNWRKPTEVTLDETKHSTVWGFLNSCTRILRDRVSVDSLVERTLTLQHDILDPYCLGV